MGALTCYQNAKSRQEALVLGFWRAPVIPNQLELLLDLDERPLICLLSVCDSRSRERGVGLLGIRNQAFRRSLATL